MGAGERTDRQMLIGAFRSCLVKAPNIVTTIYTDIKNFLVNDQRDAQFFNTYLFLFLTLYMLRAHRAHHQESQIVSIQPLVTVTLCR